VGDDATAESMVSAATTQARVPRVTVTWSAGPRPCLPCSSSALARTAQPSTAHVTPTDAPARSAPTAHRSAPSSTSWATKAAAGARMVCTGPPSLLGTDPRTAQPGWEFIGADLVAR
jgi:hypothetical protein